MPAAELSAPDGLEPTPAVAAYRDDMDESIMAEAQRRSVEAGVDSTRRRHGGAAGDGCDRCELLQVQVDSALEALERMGDQSRHTMSDQAWREARAKIASLQAEVLRLRTQQRRVREVVNAAHAVEMHSAQCEMNRLYESVQAKAAAELQELQEISAGNTALASAEILKLDAQLCEARRTIQEQEAAAAALMADAVHVSPPSSPALSSST